MIENSIARVTIKAEREMMVILHTTGMFFGTSTFALRWFDVKITQMKTLQVDREVFQALDLDGESCNESLAYDRHDCIHKQLKRGGQDWLQCLLCRLIAEI